MAIIAQNSTGPIEEKDQDILQCHRKQLRQLWEDGSNIVMGSEGGDLVIQEGVQPNAFIDGLMSIMPWATELKDNALHGRNNNDFTVVVTYRVPRVDQFVSYWKQMTSRGGREPLKLRQWTLETPNQHTQHIVDPLGMALAYAEYGLNVVLLDTSGIQRQGVDLSTVVACNVLNVSCSDSNIDIWNPRVINQLSDDGRKDMTQEELDRVDGVLKNQDCNYRNLLLIPMYALCMGISSLKHWEIVLFITST